MCTEHLGAGSDSEFIHFPIFIEVTKTERVPKKKEEKDETVKEDGETKDEEDKKDEEKKEDEFETVTKLDWELINENKPIWTRRVENVTEEEYSKFYKAITKDYEDPLYYTHFIAEGEVEFKSILFIPGRAPYNVFDTSQTQNNIRLYVRRVFITDDFKDLLPRYLNFVKGVVDSDDLPLNVSREVLQESRILKIIKKKLVRKALQMLADIADNDKRIEKEKKKDSDDKEKSEDEEKKDEKDDAKGGKVLKDITFPKLWEEFGKNLRLGMIEDGTNRARLTRLLRYKSSKSEDKLTSLEEYVDRMPDSQKSIYFLTGESVEKIKQSPFLEDAVKRDVEVLYMADAIDEYVVGHVTDFSGKKLVNLAKEGVKFEDQSKREKAIDAARDKHYTTLKKFFKDLLGERVTKVQLTKRKTSEPLIVASPQHGTTATMEKIMKAQTLGDKSGAEGGPAKRVLEINYLHPLVNEINKRIQTNETDQVAEDSAFVLFDVASMQGNFDVVDVQSFAKRVNRLLRQGVDIAADAPLLEEDPNEYDIAEEEEEKKDDEEKDASADAGAGDHAAEEEKKEDL